MHGVIEVCPPNSPYLFLLSAVYATSSVNNRDILRDDFKTIAQYIALSWISLGDFNEVLNQNEKLGGLRVNQRRCLVYRDNMDVCKMIDLGFSGPRFTWTNNRKRHPIYERLDMGWGNMEWLEKISKTNVMHLPRISSDHCPIRVRTCPTIPRGVKNRFVLSPCGSSIQISTLCYKVNGSGGGDLQHKFRDLQVTLNVWNKKVFGNLHRRKAKAMARLKGTQLYLPDNPMSRYHQNLEKDLQGEICHILF